MGQYHAVDIEPPPPRATPLWALRIQYLCFAHAFGSSRCVIRTACCDIIPLGPAQSHSIVGWTGRPALFREGLWDVLTRTQSRARQEDSSDYQCDDLLPENEMAYFSSILEETWNVRPSMTMKLIVVTTLLLASIHS